MCKRHAKEQRTNVRRRTPTDRWARPVPCAVGAYRRKESVRAPGDGQGKKKTAFGRGPKAVVLYIVGIADRAALGRRRAWQRLPVTAEQAAVGGVAGAGPGQRGDAGGHDAGAAVAQGHADAARIIAVRPAALLD